MSQIELKNINKSFDGKTILNNISLKVEEGERISLLGPSGCGKTTTLKIIAGLLKNDKGQLLIGDKDVSKVPVEKRGAVIVFQDYLLFPHMTVAENIGFGLKMAKKNKNIIKEKVDELLKLVKLEGLGDRYPDELSGGQKQRVAIARALAVDPKVLLLDEPFSNLDTGLRDEMREFISNLQRKLNITTILVTHDKEEALMISDRIAVMLNGEIKQIDEPSEIYKHPKSIEVANFLGNRNYIKGNIKEGKFETEIGLFNIDNREQKEVIAMINPEDIYLDNSSNEGLEGTITEVRYAGDRIYYKIKIKNKQIRVISNSDKVYRLNEKIFIHMDFNNGVFF
ncbi:ABC transporter ATP-binding protein [Clostridium sp. D2Q-11]|uniref:ABC-type quaternary amine transporter n=1 Tax=Anaeromonas frigoriresistens TaxID=2683708 RepID=A0A942Z6W9_9FIRM|nr:ABC transporter ATP-binding protein [Anaeromonas frigoriresistens]MBS4538042.1 ABC transporter ATP-binding protein [Anaeromonas frigoriresistens]